MQSMTGFASAECAADGMRWRFEAKSVNGRGLDLRFRLADGFEALESDLRAVAARRLSRGAVTVFLRAEGGGEAATPTLNSAALAAVIGAAKAGESGAIAAGLDLAPSSVAQLLAIRGVMDGAGGREPGEDAAKAARDAFDDLLDGLVVAREAEGARIADMFAGLIDRIEALSAEAEAAFAEHREGAAARLRDKLDALRAAEADVTPERLAQELALLAVKADVREELDRLAAHVAAARGLLAETGPIGRKLDFLTQEFNREANTLCSKSGSVRLTAAGLELKVAIDQMREQAQNVE